METVLRTCSQCVSSPFEIRVNEYYSTHFNSNFAQSFDFHCLILRKVLICRGRFSFASYYVDIQITLE